MILHDLTTSSHSHPSLHPPSALCSYIINNIAFLIRPVSYRLQLVHSAALTRFFPLHSLLVIRHSGFTVYSTGATLPCLHLSAGFGGCDFTTLNGQCIYRFSLSLSSYGAWSTLNLTAKTGLNDPVARKSRVIDVEIDAELHWSIQKHLSHCQELSKSEIKMQ